MSMQVDWHALAPTDRDDRERTEISAAIGERNNRVAYVLRQKRTIFVVSQPTEKNTRPSALVRLNPAFYPPLAERMNALRIEDVELPNAKANGREASR